MQRTIKKLFIGSLLAAAAVPGVQASVDAYGSPGHALAVTRTIKIAALDSMKFQPSKVDVRPGQTVRFVIRNLGRQQPHEFLIGNRAEQRDYEALAEEHPGLRKLVDAPNGVTIPPGQTRTLIWHFPNRTGTLEYACHEPLHYAAGMVGYIHMTPEAPK
ncbi:MAG: plastocyanin/azurin family copper-binding protein [Gammaproteobacteria bacterium]|nr:plastocyanin/azurin family copper-binding protein [Gammaproteobacteria bacterium]